MAKASNGDRVTVHYTLRTSIGDVFDTNTVGRAPLNFTLGAGQVIPGFDQAVLGMEIGERKHVTVPFCLAHGQHRPERVLHFHRTAPPDGHAPYVSEPAGRVELFIETEEAESSGSAVTQDYNHPLAGRDLTLDITLVSIDPAGRADVLPAQLGNPREQVA